MRWVLALVVFACGSSTPPPPVSAPASSAPPPAAPVRVEKLDPKDPKSLATLMGELQPLAAKWLAESQDFAPFGAGITSTGEVVQMTGDVNLDFQHQLDALVRGLGEPRWQAGILFVDVNVVPPGATAKTDAIWIITENRDGFARQIDIPYSIAGNHVTWGTPFPAPGAKPMIYPRP